MKETDLNLIALTIPVNRIETKENILSIVDFDEDQTVEWQRGFDIQFHCSIGSWKGFSTRKVSQRIIDKVTLAIIDLMR